MKADISIKRHPILHMRNIIPSPQRCVSCLIGQSEDSGGRCTAVRHIAGHTVAFQNNLSMINNIDPLRRHIHLDIKIPDIIIPRCAFAGIERFPYVDGSRLDITDQKLRLRRNIHLPAKSTFRKIDDITVDCGKIHPAVIGIILIRQCAQIFFYRRLIDPDGIAPLLNPAFIDRKIHDLLLRTKLIGNGRLHIFIIIRQFFKQFFIVRHDFRKNVTAVFIQPENLFFLFNGGAHHFKYLILIDPRPRFFRNYFKTAKRLIVCTNISILGSDHIFLL